jgi:hypothetical protein
MQIQKLLVFTRNDLKIIFIATSIGGIVQYYCWKFVKNHPESFEQLDGKKEPIEDPIKGPFLFDGRGGEFITVTVKGVEMIFNLGKLVSVLKGYGAPIFLGAATSTILAKKIPTTAVSTILRFVRKKLSNGSPISHTEWGKGHVIEINSLGECNHDFKYLVSVLLDKEIPYSDRQKKVSIVLSQQLKSQTMVSLVSFLTCVVSILVLFTFLKDTTSVFLMMQNLLEVLKEGKITKRVARILIRKLLRAGVSIDPELIEAAAN